MRKFLSVVMLCVLSLTAAVEALAWSEGTSEPFGVLVAATKTKKKAPAKKQAAKKQISPLEIAANQGDVQAQYDLAESYFRGKNGMKRNNNEALKWYTKAGEQGHAMSQFMLGVCYSEEMGVNPNGKLSALWFKKAKKSLKKEADNGNADAAYYLGIVSGQYGYEIGEMNDEANQKEALNWYHKAAQMGSAVAQATLGFHYQHGIGVKSDDAKALDWYQKAAAQNNERGLSGLAECYMDGIGVKKDSQQAADYARKACLARGKGNFWEDEYQKGENAYRKKDYQAAYNGFMLALDHH